MSASADAAVARKQSGLKDHRRPSATREGDQR